MGKKVKKQLHWVRLDNAAKIYPAARRKNWSNVFRQSVTLTEQVDVAVLQSALDVTVRRFPSIAARLRKGVFWYYLQQVEQAPDIKEEYSYPLTFMSKAEMRKCAFRVIAYENRIAVEFFHSLTDGNGALIFLKTLTAEYLEQKMELLFPVKRAYWIAVKPLSRRNWKIASSKMPALYQPAEKTAMPGVCTANLEKTAFCM